MEGKMDGWLVKVPALHHRRAPGNTCLSALLSGNAGTTSAPINNSKGCGGIMRAAPVGLIMQPDDVFGCACDIAALTHGHPCGYLSAGVLAQIVCEITSGAELLPAIERSVDRLRQERDHDECLAAVERALQFAAGKPASPETVESLGEGWVGEEALAIAVFCALKAEGDFSRGVLLAVNHGGDSDSTGSIAGNILGCLLGRDAIPESWRTRVELAAEIDALAADIVTRFRDDDAWFDRYPGW